MIRKNNLHNGWSWAMPGERRCRRRTRAGFFPRKPRSEQGGGDLFDIIDKEEWKEWTRFTYYDPGPFKILAKPGCAASVKSLS